jgi:hypothetical protein
MLFFADRSFAAASAPVRAARKTGLFELFPIIAIVNFFPVVAARADSPAGLSLALFEQPASATKTAADATPVHLNLFVITSLR